MTGKWDRDPQEILEGNPTFLYKPDREGRARFIRILAVVFAAGLTIPVCVLFRMSEPPGWEKNGRVAEIVPFAGPNPVCPETDQIIKTAIKDGLTVPFRIAAACSEIGPSFKFTDRMRPGQVAIVLRTHLLERSYDYEFRTELGRYFIIMIDRAKHDRDSVDHELSHIYLGHPPIQAPILLRKPINTLLDFRVKLHQFGAMEWALLLLFVVVALGSYLWWGRERGAETRQR